MLSNAPAHPAAPPRSHTFGIPARRHPHRPPRTAITSIVAISIVAFALLAPPARAQSLSDDKLLGKRVVTLVDQLKAPAFKTREQATLDLLDLGEPIHPQLRTLLDEKTNPLSTEQQQRIEEILTSDPLSSLERRSGFSDEDLALFRGFREGTSNQTDKLPASHRMEELAQTPDVSDAGLALLVRTLTAVLPADLSPANVGVGSAFPIIKAAAHSPNANRLTTSAVTHWVKDWLIPYGLTPTESQRSGYLYSMTSGILYLARADALEEPAYTAFLNAYCDKIASGRKFAREEIGLDRQIVIGLAYSRHATSDHLGRLIQALLTRSTLAEFDGSDPISMLTYIASSPNLTEAQARALIDALLDPNVHNSLSYDAVDIIENLTGRLTTLDPDWRIRPYGANAVSEEWRAWWAQNRNAPLLTKASDKRYRYILVDIRSENGSDWHPVIAVDEVVQPSWRAELFHHRSDRSTCSWVRLNPHPFSRTSIAQKEILTSIPNRIHCETWSFRDGQFGWAGPPPYSRWARVTGNGKLRELRYTAIGLLHDLADGPGPTDEQLHSLDYWTNRVVVDTASVQHHMRRTSQGANVGYWWTYYSLLQFEAYPKELFAPPIRALAKTAEPDVAATAWLLLARWGQEVEQSVLLPMLHADDDHTASDAAQVLARRGRPEAVRALIERVKGDMPSRSAYQSLLKLSDSPGYPPDTKAQLAGEIIRALLPKTDGGTPDLLQRVILARQWSGQDFGYQLGADADHNTAALARYHEWAAHP